MSDRKKEYMKVYNKEYSLKNKEKIKENRKEYMKAYNKQYRLNNKEKIKELNKNWHLKNIEKVKKYNIDNKERKKETNKNWRINNKERSKQKESEWLLNNKEKRLHYINEYNKNRKKNDPLFKLRHNIRKNITTLIKRNGYTKKSRTYQILGCSYEDFKKHIEKQFTNGMNWENQGQWHLDHIYPVSLAKDEEHLIQLNHYTNFQPLWAIDNLRKSNKIIDATT